MSAIRNAFFVCALCAVSLFASCVSTSRLQPLDIAAAHRLFSYDTYSRNYDLNSTWRTFEPATDARRPSVIRGYDSRSGEFPAGVLNCYLSADVRISRYYDYVYLGANETVSVSRNTTGRVISSYYETNGAGNGIMTLVVAFGGDAYLQFSSPASGRGRFVLSGAGPETIPGDARYTYTFSGNVVPYLMYDVAAGYPSAPRVARGR